MSFGSLRPFMAPGPPGPREFVGTPFGRSRPARNGHSGSPAPSRPRAEGVHKGARAREAGGIPGRGRGNEQHDAHDKEDRESDPRQEIRFFSIHRVHHEQPLSSDLPEENFSSMQGPPESREDNGDLRHASSAFNRTLRSRRE